MKHIVVAVDGSEASCHAAKFAQTLASDTGAELSLLYVYNAPAAVMLGFGALNQAQVDSTKELVAKGSFDQAKAAMGEGGDTAQTKVVIGHPGTEIVGFAKEKAADLIVMGSRGMSGVAGLLMGSVSEYVVRHASCPVTIVR